MKKIFSVLSAFGLTFAAMANINAKPVDWSKAGPRIGRAVPRPRNAALFKQHIADMPINH